MLSYLDVIWLNLNYFTLKSFADTAEHDQKESEVGQI